MKCPECGIESIDGTFALSAPELAHRCKHYDPASICPNIQRLLNEEAARQAAQKPPE